MLAWVEVYLPSSCFSCLFFIFFSQGKRVRLVSLPLRLGLIVLSFWMNCSRSSKTKGMWIITRLIWFKLRTTKINIFASEIVVSSTQPHRSVYRKPLSLPFFCCVLQISCIGNKVLAFSIDATIHSFSDVCSCPFILVGTYYTIYIYSNRSPLSTEIDLPASRVLRVVE